MSRFTDVCGQVREILTDADHDGIECPSDRSRDVPCNENPCPVDCALTDFVEVMSCSVSCGGGFKKFQRKIQTPPQNGGAPCDAPFEEDEACNEDPYAAVEVSQNSQVAEQFRRTH